METRAVIFDMDGLLIDTEPVWRRVEIEVFGSLGLHLTEEQCMEMMGVPIGEIVGQRFLQHPWTGPSPGAVTRQILDKVVDHVLSEGEPQPGAVQALHMVHDAGLPIGVASSSSLDLIHAVLRRLDMEQYVSAACSADDEERGKPDPAVYFSAARALGVPPPTCVALEDSPNGVLSAKSAGMYCIVVPDPYLAGDPRMRQADLMIPTLEAFSLQLLPGRATAGFGN